MNAIPGVSVIICSRGRPAFVVGAVKSVLAGDALPGEIVVVDQSDEPNRDLEALGLKGPCGLQYRWERGSGVSRARNSGIAAARHGIIALLDDDILVASQWLHSLVTALIEGGPRTLVTGSVIPMEAGTKGGFAPATKIAAERFVYHGIAGAGKLATGNMAVFRAAAAEAGGFDERLGPGTAFPSSEDNDLCYRLVSAGYQLIYEPSAAVYHLAWRPRREFLPLRWAYGRGQGAFYAKFVSVGDTYLLRRGLADIGRRSLRAPWRLCRGHWRAAAGDVVFVAGLIAGSAEWVLRECRPRRRERALVGGAHEAR